MPALIGGIASAAITGGLGYLGSSQQSSAAQAAAGRAAELNYQSQVMGMNFANQEAEEQRMWQESMSSTAYQRAVNDMSKAGLNPMLAYQQGGAGTPSGAMGSAPGGHGAPVAATFNKVAGALGSAQQAAEVYRTKAEAEKSEAQTELISNHEKYLVQAKIRQELANAGKLEAEGKRVEQELQYFENIMLDRIRKYGYETLEAWWKQMSEKYRSGILNSEDQEATRYFVARAKDLKFRAEITGLQIPEAMSEAAFFKSDVGRHAAFTRTPSRALTSAAESALDTVEGIGRGVRQGGQWLWDRAKGMFR